MLFNFFEIIYFLFIKEVFKFIIYFFDYKVVCIYYNNSNNNGLYLLNI